MSYEENLFYEQLKVDLGKYTLDELLDIFLSHHQEVDVNNGLIHSTNIPYYMPDHENGNTKFPERFRVDHESAKVEDEEFKMAGQSVEHFQGSPTNLSELDSSGLNSDHLSPSPFPHPSEPLSPYFSPSPLMPGDDSGIFESTLTCKETPSEYLNTPSKKAIPGFPSFENPEFNPFPASKNVSTWNDCNESGLPQGSGQFNCGGLPLDNLNSSQSCEKWNPKSGCGNIGTPFHQPSGFAVHNPNLGTSTSNLSQNMTNPEFNPFPVSKNVSTWSDCGESGLPQGKGQFSCSGLPLDNSNSSQSCEKWNPKSGNGNMINSFNNFPKTFPVDHNASLAGGNIGTPFHQPSDFAVHNPYLSTSTSKLSQNLNSPTSLLDQNYSNNNNSFVSPIESRSFISSETTNPMASGKGHKRRSKISRTNMTEEDKRLRAISQNNYASKEYRQRKKAKKQSKKERLKLLLHNNEQLTQFQKDLEYKVEQSQKMERHLETLGFSLSQLHLQD